MFKRLCPSNSDIYIEKLQYLKHTAQGVDFFLMEDFTDNIITANLFIKHSYENLRMH